jgi:hypothetical protein
VIIYHDTKAADRDTPPPWLVGAIDLHRRDGKGQRWWGVGPSPWLVGDHPGDWIALDDGWRCRLVGELDPLVLRRHQHWCDTAPAVDLQGRRWCTPVILADDGQPIFRVTYGGDDFLPQLTPEQTQAKEIALAARQALKTGGIEGAHAKRWAARLLEIANHISVQVIARTGLMDDVLVLSALSPVTGLPLKREESAPA